jgi:probable rRNA maturation factor
LASIDYKLSMPIRVRIASPQEFVVIEKARFRALVPAVLSGEGISHAEISLAFVDDPTIHRINKQFLDHDEPTDVITFPLKKKPLEAELVIGVEVAQREAAERKLDVQDELALYVVHGLLHLCGYDDHSDRDRSQMRERERRYLNK